MFEDEARFGRRGAPRRCGAPAGVRPAVRHQFVREYLYAYAAVSPHDGTVDRLVLPGVETEAMTLFLAAVAARHAEEFLVMVLDGAGWHCADALAVPANRHLVRLPPYRPELNPTEHLWDEIREKWFANTFWPSLAAVEDQLVHALIAIEADPARVARLAGFDWITTIPLNAN
jgi:hypothetical protein